MSVYSDQQQVKRARNNIAACSLQICTISKDRAMLMLRNNRQNTLRIIRRISCSMIGPIVQNVQSINQSVNSLLINRQTAVKTVWNSIV